MFVFQLDVFVCVRLNGPDERGAEAGTPAVRVCLVVPF